MSVQPGSWGGRNFLVQLLPWQRNFSANNEGNEQMGDGEGGEASVSRTAEDSGLVAEGTPCGEGVMGYFWTDGLLLESRADPHPH